MEYLKKIFNKTGWASIIESLIFAILGIILVYKPEGTVKVISIILGVVFITAGICKIISYFMTKDENDFYNYDLVYGLMAIVIGIVSIAYINIIGSVFRIIIGVWIIYTSFVRINFAIQMKKINSNSWLYGIILAVLMFCCGLYIIMNSQAIIVTIGIVMIVYSIIDIIENAIFMININKIL